MRYAIIENGTVVNVAEAEAGFSQPAGWVEATGGVQIGWTYNGSVFAAPSVDLTARKADMRAEVTALVRAKQQAGALTPEGVVDSDIESRNKLNGAVLMAMLAAQAAQPFSISWTLADNSNVTLDGSEMIAMASAVGSYVAACHANGQTLKAAIEAAADHAELDAIDMEAGWP